MKRQIEGFIKHLEGRNDSPCTVRAYRSDLVDFAAFMARHRGGVPRPADVTRLDCRAWMVSLRNRGLSKATIGRKVAVLRSWYDWLGGEGAVKVNVGRMIEAPRNERALPRFLDKFEVVRLIESADSARDRAILEMLYATGCRVSELASMKVSDINHDENEIVIMGQGLQGAIRLLPREGADQRREVSRDAEGRDQPGGPAVFEREGRGADRQEYP